MPGKRVAAKPVQKAPGGRPRKYADSDIADAALRVMEREGYAALTIRALAQELGTSHSTLYNYVGHIEDVEAQALHRLTGTLPMPSATKAAALRAELIAYLLAVFRLLAQHPGVLFPPMGSTSFKTMYAVGEDWVRALLPHAPDEKTVRLGLGALVAIVVVAAERDRIYGPESGARIRKAMGKPAVVGTLEETLDAMMDLVLPALRDRAVRR